MVSTDGVVSIVFLLIHGGSHLHRCTSHTSWPPSAMIPPTPDRIWATRWAAAACWKGEAAGIKPGSLSKIHAKCAVNTCFALSCLAFSNRGESLVFVDGPSATETIKTIVREGKARLSVWLTPQARSRSKQKKARHPTRYPLCLFSKDLASCCQLFCADAVSHEIKLKVCCLWIFLFFLFFFLLVYAL